MKFHRRETKNRSDLVRNTPNLPEGVGSAARGNVVSTLRGKATNTASRGSRGKSISGKKTNSVAFSPQLN
jgi:hypothetical protein